MKKLNFAIVLGALAMYTGCNGGGTECVDGVCTDNGSGGEAGAVETGGTGNEGNQPSTGGEAGTTPCVPGKNEDCRCSDGRDGSQQCKSDGSGFKACECTGPVPGTGGSGGEAGSDNTGGTGNEGNEPSTGGDSGRTCHAGDRGGDCSDECPDGQVGEKVCRDDEQDYNCICSNPEPPPIICNPGDRDGDCSDECPDGFTGELVCRGNAMGYNCLCAEEPDENPPEADGCSTDNECKGLRVCLDGACADPDLPEEPDCTTDLDCSGDLVCVNGDCVAQSPECTSDTDCSGSQVCTGGECVEPPTTSGCSSDNDCKGDRICRSDSVCVNPPVSSPPPSSGNTRTITIDIYAEPGVDHVWCEGAEVEKGSHLADNHPDLQWYEAWHTLGYDAFDDSSGLTEGVTYHAVVTTNADHSFRFQCYLKKPGNVVDKERYTCGAPGLYEGESFDVSSSYYLVQNLHNSTNCQVD